MKHRAFPSPLLFLFTAFLLLWGEGCERETQNAVLVVRPQGLSPDVLLLQAYVSLNNIAAANPVDFTDPVSFAELDLRLPSGASGMARIILEATDSTTTLVGRGIVELDIPGAGRYEIAVPMAPLQTGWRWCHKCQGLFFSSNPDSACPAGGTHEAVSSLSYILAYGTTPPDSQTNWWWCRKCQGLHSLESTGVCPRDGLQHDTAGSLQYVVPAQMGGGAQQGQWRRCSACGGIFFSANPSFACSGHPGSHVADTTTEYFIDH